MTDIYEIGQLASIKLEPQTRQRFDIQVGNTTVHAMAYIRIENPRLAAFCNGAVSLKAERTPQETFQRHSWAEEIDSSSIFLADPTLAQGERINLGWGQGTLEAYALPAMSLVVQELRKSLEISSDQTTYVGSSGGGFQALMLGSMDPGSQVMVNNPQTNWLNYTRKFAVERILNSSYNGMSAEEVYAEYPERCSIIDAFIHFGTVPKIRYLLNAYSTEDISVDYMHLLEGLPKVFSTWNSEIIETIIYNDEKTGHHPIVKKSFLHYLNDFITGE